MTVLLSDAFFQSRFGGDPSIIGKTITLNRVPHTVIGVVPPVTTFVEPGAGLGAAGVDAAETAAVRNNHNYRGIAQAEARRRRGPRAGRPECDLDAARGRLSRRQQGLGRAGACRCRTT